MPTLLQINITANWGSHGKIAEGIGKIALSNGWRSIIAYGRWYNPSQSELYQIGSIRDEQIHGVTSRIMDNHGLMSRGATRRLIDYIETVNPDIIHLHNIHGYYLNYPILFDYLAKTGKPIVWTLHDCWAYTGHCAHYMFARCDKWKTLCQHCPQRDTYPKSILLDRSKRNYLLKKHYFCSVPDLTLIAVSQWLQNDVKQSFLKDLPLYHIHNGIDTNTFYIDRDTDGLYTKYNIPHDKKIVLGVASNWFRKGFEDFIQLRHMLDDEYTIVLVGLTDKMLKQLPTGIIGIKRTQNVADMRKLYSIADVYMNLTWEDNFPTTNLEALACGTPVITYDTGGSSESLTQQIGKVIDQGDISAALDSIRLYSHNPVPEELCRQHIVDNFNSEQKFHEYFKLYCSLLSHHK